MRTRFGLVLLIVFCLVFCFPNFVSASSMPEEPVVLSVYPASSTTVTIPMVTVYGQTNADKVHVAHKEVEIVGGKFSANVSLPFIGLNLIAIDGSKGSQGTAQVITIYYSPKKIEMKLEIGKTLLITNGVISVLEAPPVIINSRTFIPIRAVVEPVGGILSWNPASGKVGITVGRDIVEMFIGRGKAWVNGRGTSIDSNEWVVPVIINGRTFLPLRFVAESLEFEVKWTPSTKTIELVYDGW